MVLRTPMSILPSHKLKHSQRDSRCDCMCREVTREESVLWADAATSVGTTLETFVHAEEVQEWACAWMVIG